tara:strand:+ start:1007 stop:1708 length:702 start_codon:yes stop_codon:yes gene_type:complete
MYLFGLEGSGFIISLGLTLLISGAIMFYLLKRFQVLESSIIDNARILQTFINRTQEQEINKNLASNIALESAIRQQNDINKIEVSDDEEDSESENDIDESNVESDDSDDERVELIDNSILSPELVESVKIIAINDFEELKTDKLLDVNNIEDLGTLNSENNDDEEEYEEDGEDEVKEINTLDINDKKDEKSTNYAKFKISELKELVHSKNLLDENTDINKLKKVDLIKLLQNN